MTVPSAITVYDAAKRGGMERDMARITVTPADDDEIILAGVPAEPPVERESFSKGEAEASAPEAKDEYASVTGVEREQVARRNPEVLEDLGADGSGGESLDAAVDSASQVEEASDSASRAVSAPADAHYETTLADLKPSPMPLAQKIVIVAAVVCIIGALIYYFTVMR